MRSAEGEERCRRCRLVYCSDGPGCDQHCAFFVPFRAAAGRAVFFLGARHARNRFGGVEGGWLFGRTCGSETFKRLPRQRNLWVNASFSEPFR
jgi:hypothetical protein